MSTIQNLKNFIRHGKQARQVGGGGHGDPTTNISPVHAQQQRYNEHPPQQYHNLSDPTIGGHKPIHAGHVAGVDYSAANVDNRNIAAQAGGAAARAAGDGQKLGNGGTTERKKDFDPAVIERIVAEERESKGKLPRYPGLERYKLLEKMGDGAFSNVYRAKDSTGEFDEVAIKVVRKFEMNSNQVSMDWHPEKGLSFAFAAISLVFLFLYVVQVISATFETCQPRVVSRATVTYIRTSRNSQKSWRCASNFHKKVFPFSFYCWLVV